MYHIDTYIHTRTTRSHIWESKTCVTVAIAIYVASLHNDLKAFYICVDDMKTNVLLPLVIYTCM